MELLEMAFWSPGFPGRSEFEYHRQCSQTACPMLESGLMAPFLGGLFELKFQVQAAFQACTPNAPVIPITVPQWLCTSRGNAAAIYCRFPAESCRSCPDLVNELEMIFQDVMWPLVPPSSSSCQGALGSSAGITPEPDPFP